MPAHPDAARGALAATASFLIWGVVPVYWKQMQGVSALELITHRIAWSLLFLLGVLWWQNNLRALRPAFTESRTFGLILLSSVLLAVNWVVYIWAVNSGHVIESSLGYFLVPLVNVALGSLLLQERLRPPQWIAIGFAAAGVGVLLTRAGHVPWIALTLAGTWAGYGLLKKRSALGSIAGLTVETILLFPLAAGLLLWWHHTGEGALGRVDLRLHLYILSVGVVTAIPLLLFAYGAQRIRLATLGLLQYLAPSVQFLIGWLVYREPFDAARLQAFGLIWCGLALYSADAFWIQRRMLLKSVGAG
ncbi:MAG: EamA family transporter RarD [Opitutae bacterium]|nr:EamA family transporter RarD [Opitutae bacterium]